MKTPPAVAEGTELGRLNLPAQGQIGCVEAHGDPRFEFERALRVHMQIALTAETVARTFDELATTYRFMAKGTRSVERRLRYLRHAAHLEHEAEREREASLRLRRIVADGGP